MSEKFKDLFKNAWFPLLLICIIWLVQLITILEGYQFTFLGIYPLHLKGIPGILLSPFVHGSIEHAASNTMPLLFLGTALHYAYPKLAYKIWLFATLFCGIWVWLAARESYHIGASGVVYGLFGFLFVRGLLSQQRRLMGLCLLVGFLYGSMIWGIFPIEEGISWEAHMFGLMAGASLAVYYRKDSEYKKPSPWDIVGEENYIAEAEQRFGPRYWEGNSSNPQQENPIEIVYHFTERKKNNNGETEQ